MLNEEQDLLPVEQQTLTFYGKPIVVVRLPDGQPGMVLRFLCENLQIDTAAQTQRVRRTKAIARGLVFAQVETGAGSLRMAVLILHAIPFWLAGIDPRRTREVTCQGSRSRPTLYYKADVAAYVVEERGVKWPEHKRPDPASLCKQKGRVLYTTLERDEM
jgi:hypothetical protein